MATLTRAAAVALAVLAACQKPVGLGGGATPLARIQVQVTGDLGPLRPPGTEAETPSLQVALVWGAQWLPEPFCVLPAESPAVATAIQAGCPDSFGFVPLRVAASVPLGADGRATLQLFDLPSADDMVGDVTARIAYGSLVVYDDRNGSGTLELRRSRRDQQDAPDDGGIPVGPPPSNQDIVYAASFVSMTLPDQRIAFREGDYNAVAAFYPRSGCPAPPKSFSVLGAGGFSASAALLAIVMGQLPAEDPASCTTGTLDGTVVVLPLQPPASVSQVACTQRGSGGTTRYREPPSDPTVLDGRTWACAQPPDLGRLSGDAGVASALPQLVLTGNPSDACKGLSHYILRGCDNDPNCASPSWDHTASPPSWWPCPVTP